MRATSVRSAPPRGLHRPGEAGAQDLWVHRARDTPSGRAALGRTVRAPRSVVLATRVVVPRAIHAALVPPTLATSVPGLWRWARGRARQGGSRPVALGHRGQGRVVLVVAPEA